MNAGARERLFPAALERLDEVAELVAVAAGEAGVPAHRGQQLALAVEEAFTNVCRHAYGGGGGDVLVRAGVDGEAFVVELSDWGPAFDPLSRPEPDTRAALADRTPGGLGILLIRRLMDAVEYERSTDANVLRMKVRLAANP